MSSAGGKLSTHHYNGHRPLDSASHVFHNISDEKAKMPEHSVMMDVPRYEDYNFPYTALPTQPILQLNDQPNVSQPADPYAQHPPVTMDPNQSITVHTQPLAFDTTVPGHHGQNKNAEAASDQVSPATNSIDDPAADEFGLTSNACADGTDLGGKAKEDKSDSKAAWTELKTKAGKERKRLPLACIACRRKKIRCSGEKPSCRHCLRSRMPCVYKVTARKAAPRTDYMAMLDKRLKRMEERIIKVIPKSEQEATINVTRAVVKPVMPGTAQSTKGGSKKRGAEEAFGKELESWAQAPIRSRIVGDDRPNTLQVQEEEENKLLHEGSDALPSKEIQEHLAEIFFDNIYGQSYHLLHKPSYMRKLKNNTLPPVLVLSVCAVAARFAANPQLNSSTPQFLRGEEWASQARDICMRRYEWPNLTILTCLLILGLHEFGTCQGGRSWALGGQAIRMAFALQLHRDLEYDAMGRNGKRTRLSFIDREIRRRIMWACFLMDRFNSSGTDRPMFVREETIQIPLPIKERYFQLDMPAPTETLDGRVLHPALPDDGQPADARENMGVAAFMIRAISYWGQAITYLNQGGREMDSHSMWEPESDFAKLLGQLEGFEATLPPSLQYSQENIEVHKTDNTAAQFFFLHICIHQNILFMNQAAQSTSMARSQKGAPDDFYSEASRKMITAANRISDVLKESERLGQFVSTPFAGYCAFSSTNIHIMGLTQPSRKATAEKNLTINVKYLHRMKKHWGMFHWMVENIRARYRSTIDSARSGNSTDEAAAQMLQYGDWFNRYPHGLSDAEFMDPATIKKKDKGADGVLESKTELQSVEEYISTLSPSQSSDCRDSVRPPKRKSGFKKQTGTDDQQAQQLEVVSNPDLGGQTMSDQTAAGQQQQRRYSAQLIGQTSGPTGFSPMAVTQAQAFNTTMSPISPGNTSFTHHSQVTQFFPQELMAMSLGHQLNGSLHPAFGGYSMDATSMAFGPNMMDGVDWDSMAAGTPNAGGRRASGRGSVGGHGHGAMDASLQFTGHEASSAWFMPFNLEPPEMSQDMGFGLGAVDPFSAMFNGGSGLTTPPNTLGGLQHGP